jgi:hypothetical protein
MLKRTWWSVASDIDELKQLAHKLETEDGGQKARLLSGKILAAVPRFEATEEVRQNNSTLYSKTNIEIEAETSRVQTGTKAAV